MFFKIGFLAQAGAGAAGGDTPDLMVFGPSWNATVATVTTSQSQQVTGIGPTVSVSVAGATAQWRKADNEAMDSSPSAWGAASGDIDLNQWIQVRITSNAAPVEVSQATLTVGTEDYAFDVYTVAPQIIYEGTHYEDPDLAQDIPFTLLNVPMGPAIAGRHTLFAISIWTAATVDGDLPVLNDFTIDGNAPTIDIMSVGGPGVGGGADRPLMIVGRIDLDSVTEADFYFDIADIPIAAASVHVWSTTRNISVYEPGVTSWSGVTSNDSNFSLQRDLTIPANGFLIGSVVTKWLDEDNIGTTFESSNDVFNLVGYNYVKRGTTRQWGSIGVEVPSVPTELSTRANFDALAPDNDFHSWPCFSYCAYAVDDTLPSYTTVYSSIYEMNTVTSEVSSKTWGMNIPAALVVGTPTTPTRMRINFRATDESTVHNLDSIYIGHQSGSDECDATDLVEVKFDGTSGLVLENFRDMVSDEFVFAYDGTSDLVIRFHSDEASSFNVPGYQTEAAPYEGDAVQTYDLDAGDVTATEDITQGSPESPFAHRLLKRIQIGEATGDAVDPFYFQEKAATDYSTLYTSQAVKVTGLGATTPVLDISGDGSPQFQVANDADFTDLIDDWGNATSTIAANNWVRVRLTSSSQFLTEYTATLDIDSSAFTADFVVTTKDWEWEAPDGTKWGINWTSTVEFFPGTSSSNHSSIENNTYRRVVTQVGIETDASVPGSSNFIRRWNRSGTTEGLQIIQSWVGHKAISGDEYDMEDQAQFLFNGGNVGFGIADPSSMQASDPLLFTYDGTSDLVFSESTANDANNQFRYHLGVTGATYWFKDDVDEADILDVTSYTVGTATRLYFPRLEFGVGFLSDTDPTGFSFTDTTDADVDTQYESDIIQVVGMSADAIVQVSDGEWQSSTDEFGASPVTTWQSGDGTIANDLYIQIRNTSDSSAGDVITAYVRVGDKDFTYSIINSIANQVEITLTDTDAATWTVPIDWNPADNTVTVTGGGAGGASQPPLSNLINPGGGGGATSSSDDLTFSPGEPVDIQVGVGGLPDSDGEDSFLGDTVFGTSDLAAEGGFAGVRATGAGGLGGDGGNGIGTITTSGGDGGSNSSTLRDYAHGGTGGGSSGTLEGDGTDGSADLSPAPTLRSGSRGGGGGGFLSAAIHFIMFVGSLSGNYAGFPTGGDGGRGKKGRGKRGKKGCQFGGYIGFGGGGGGGGGGSLGLISDVNATTEGGDGGAGGIYGGGGGGAGGGRSRWSTQSGGTGADGVILISYVPLTGEQFSYDFTIPADALNSDLTSFVSKIDLSDPVFDSTFWSVVEYSGGNIRVVEDDDTEMPFDVVYIDHADQKGEVFFRHTLSSSVDNDFKLTIVMEDEAHAVDATYGRNNTWQDYDHVWIFPSLADRTGTLGDLTLNSAVTIDTNSGPFKHWLLNPGANDYAHATGVTQRTQFTMGTMNHPDATSAIDCMMAYGDSAGEINNFALWSRSGVFALENGADGFLESVGLKVEIDIPYVYVGQQDGTAARHGYLDGNIDITETSLQTQVPSGGGDEVFIGTNVDGTSDDFAGHHKYGYIRNGLLSAEWIRAEYVSWNQQAQFLRASNGSLGWTASFNITGDGNTTSSDRQHQRVVLSPAAVAESIAIPTHTHIRVTFEASSTEGVTLTRAGIGHQNGAVAYETDDMTELTFNKGLRSVNIATGGTAVSDPVPFVYNKTDNLVIAFRVSQRDDIADGVRSLATGPSTSVTYGLTTEATNIILDNGSIPTMTTSPGDPNGVWGVMKIEFGIV